MTRWRFLDRDIVLAIHEELLAAHRGAIGLISEPALTTALSRPKEIARAAPSSDAARLAAACAYGFVRSHPFVDGKKGVALTAMELFLADNGYELTARDEDCFIIMEQLSNREIDEEGLAVWVRANISANRAASKR